jgi:hypothetical protein
MKPGDKVRFIHSKGEGIIRRILDQKNIEVEIEDGFIVPFLKSDLVIVSSEEARITGTEDKSSFFNEDTPSFVLNGNIWLAFVPFNDKIYSVYLVNDTTQEVLFSVGHSDQSMYEGIFAGSLKKNSSIKISDAQTNEFENWPEWIIQAIYFSFGKSELKDPVFKKFKFKANSFFKNKQSIPVLQKDGHLFKIDGPGTFKVPTEQVIENMFSPSEPKPSVLSKPAKEIDLHIDKLVASSSKMSNSEMLKIQLEAFEKNLDTAIATGMDEIIFIHGVGNGVLRQEIHKLLSKNKLIKFFQDARKEKFGYGATLVRLK